MNEKDNEFGHDDLGVDLGAQSDLDHEIGGAERPSMREVWQGNPLLKIGAVVVGGIALVGAYMTFFAADPLEEVKSTMRGVNAGEVSITPGQDEMDEVYRQQVEERNRQKAEAAAVTGGSSIDTPTPSAQSTGLDISQARDGESDSDPLKEWRKNVEARREEIGPEEAEEEVLAPQPEVVPMVQPIRPQQTVKMDPKAATNMAQQMRTVIATQNPLKSSSIQVTKSQTEYAVMRDEEALLKKENKLNSSQSPASTPHTSSATTAGGNAGTQASMDRVIIPAGQIAYAQLLTELNSDVPGPALALVMSGPFAGARALGTMQTKEDFIVITFNRFIKDGVSYEINGIALDEATTLPAHRTDIDHHYFSRIILPAAATFLEGFASSVAETGTSSTTTTGGGVVAEQPEPETEESLYKGMEEAAGVVTKILTEDAKTKPTIKVAKGTTMGVLFLDAVRTSNAN